MKRFAVLTIAAVWACAGTAARADDVTGAEKLLCSAVVAGACCDDGQCAGGTAQELNIPQFLEVDLVHKRISTTKASGMNRGSTFDNVKRVEGKIVLQGVENLRAYSIVIDEKTGSMSAAVAAELCSVTAYGSCTPLTSSK